MVDKTLICFVYYYSAFVKQNSHGEPNNYPGYRSMRADNLKQIQTIEKDISLEVWATYLHATGIF